MLYWRLIMSEQPPNRPPITAAMIAAAEPLSGLSFTPDERALMLEKLAEYRQSYEALRQIDLSNDQPPALRFQPGQEPKPEPPETSVAWEASPAPTQPTDLEEVAYWSLSDLARLLHSRQISSLELTEMFLARLKRFDPLLHCVINLTEERALDQARRADAELAAGRPRGPLHGIPWGAKDLLAVRGYATTWGAAPYREQVLDLDASVVRRLDEAGAVLVAKLSVGALAWGDVWFGGKTRTPWNPEQGASGSSAGPAAATAAGLVGFSIGTETWGSIVSPATRCGVSGLRPTYGRVSRHGCMTLAWSMDKIGPMCRTVEDCALVFAAIHGADGYDASAVSRPFVWDPDIDPATLRVGYVAAAFEEDYTGRAQDLAVLEQLRQLGCTLVPIALPHYPIDALAFIVSAEAAATFDALTRSNEDDRLVRQEVNAWPNVFRSARTIPAVEYLQAQRLRSRLIGAMHDLMAGIDLYVAPSLAGDNLLLTNLTGQPAVVVPNGLNEEGTPTSITFTGRWYDESTVLALASRWQAAAGFHQRHPSLPISA